METTCYRRIGNVWFGVALDEKKRVISCGFSTGGREDIVRSIGNIPADQISETTNNEYASAILESLSLIYQGKAPTIVPELAWERLPSFHRKALMLTAKIPRGFVATYGGIAAGLGQPKAGRAVGNAEAVNPFAPLVPCHRVISSQRKLGGYGGGLPAKKAFLLREGVVFDGEQVSPMCVWIPKPAEIS